ncbi:MAG: M48 family metalloprotease [Gammaproteobacteria bacterium]|nr:M48 family metalloprotease [Gammaproteobacteria bacterium]
MKLLLSRVVLILLLSLAASGGVHAKKYRPVNDIPGQVPETDEERGIWQVGIAHQNQVRGTEELVNDPELEHYIEGVIKRLMGSMVEEIGMEVDVLVFKDPTVNAWVYPNGTVGVQTGLLAAMENEAQLAAILGHEVSHFLNRHAFIQIKAKQKTSVLGKGLGVLATVAVAAKTGQVDTGLLTSGQIWTDLVTSGYSRKLESAADSQGLHLMAAAGYPPEQALPAFETMRLPEDNVVDVAKMWSSHPDIDARKKNLSKQIKKNKAVSSGAGMDSERYLHAIRAAALSNAQLQMKYRKFDAAIARLEKFTQALDTNPAGHFLLGEAYRKQTPEGNLAARISAYQNAITHKPDYADPYRELGMAYRQQGQKQQAYDAYSRYLELAGSALDAPIIGWYRDNLAAISTAPQ